MKTVSGFELHFVPKRHDNGTLKNKRLLAVRDHQGVPLFFENIEAINAQVDSMSRIVVDMVFYAKPVRRKIDPPPAEATDPGM